MMKGRMRISFRDGRWERRRKVVALIAAVVVIIVAVVVVRTVARMHDELKIAFLREQSSFEKTLTKSEKGTIVKI